MASESKPTEPVSHHASILSTMVMTATNTEIRSKLRGVNPTLQGRREPVVMPCYSFVHRNRDCE